MRLPPPQLAAARAWRIANKPRFDALYGSTHDHDFMREERRRGLIYARQWRLARVAPSNGSQESSK